MQIRDLKQDSRNYRIHGKRNLDLIRKSVDECGFGRSVVIDNENEIICGNGLISQCDKNTKIRVVESDGSELIVVKRTDLKTADEKRKQLAIMDNSTSDSSEFDLELLQEDFEIQELKEAGIELLIPDSDIDEFMDNDSLQEFDTNKQLALSKMPISKYLCIVFDEEMTKNDFIEKVVKKLYPDSDINERTQYCNYSFLKKDIMND